MHSFSLKTEIFDLTKGLGLVLEYCVILNGPKYAGGQIRLSKDALLALISIKSMFSDGIPQNRASLDMLCLALNRCQTCWLNQL